jgi:hypothetical protein
LEAKLKQQVTALLIRHVYELGVYADSLGIGPVCIEKAAERLPIGLRMPPPGVGQAPSNMQYLHVGSAFASNPQKRNMQ